MTDFDIKCKHCNQEIASSTMDEAYRWLHEDTGNAFCNGEIFATPQTENTRTIAEPNVDQLRADVEEALDEKYELVYVQHDDRFSVEQVQAMLDGEDWSNKDLERFEEWRGEAQYTGAREALEELVREGDARDLLEATNHWYELIDEIRERDSSDTYKEMLSSTPDMLFRYWLNVSVPDYTVMNNEEQRKAAFAEIAEATGLDRLMPEPQWTQIIWTVVQESSYGGQLYVLWYGDVETAMKIADPIRFKTDGDFDRPVLEESQGHLVWTGASMLILDRFNGAGWCDDVQVMVTDWVPRRVTVDAKHFRGYSWTDTADPVQSYYAAEVEVISSVKEPATA